MAAKKFEMDSKRAEKESKKGNHGLVIYILIRQFIFYIDYKIIVIIVSNKLTNKNFINNNILIK